MARRTGVSRGCEKGVGLEGAPKWFESSYFCSRAAHIAKNVSMAISSLSDACIIIADAQSARLKLHKRVGAETQYCYPEFLEVANLYRLEDGLGIGYGA